jgi:hypothetical protein
MLPAWMMEWNMFSPPENNKENKMHAPTAVLSNTILYLF